MSSALLCTPAPPKQTQQFEAFQVNLEQMKIIRASTASAELDAARRMITLNCLGKQDLESLKL